MFSTLHEPNLSFLPTFILLSAIVFNLESSKTSLFVNPFSNKPFLYVSSTSLLKTLWEKEKLLLMSSFSFSHSVFYQSWKLSAIFIKFEILVCNPFQEVSKICRFRKG